MISDVNEWPLVWSTFFVQIGKTVFLTVWQKQRTEKGWGKEKKGVGSFQEQWMQQRERRTEVDVTAFSYEGQTLRPIPVVLFCFGLSLPVLLKRTIPEYDWVQVKTTLLCMFLNSLICLKKSIYINKLLFFLLNNCG